MKPYARVVAAEISRLKRCRAYKQHWWGCVWQGGATRTAQVAHDYRWWQPGAKIRREHREKGAGYYEWRSQTLKFLRI